MTDTPEWTSPSPEGPGQSTPGWGAPPPPGAPPPGPGQGWGGAPPAAPGWGTQQQAPAWGGAGGPGWSGAPVPSKPGVIPLRPLGLGEILDGAITTMRTYAGAALGFGVTVAAVAQLLSFFLLDTLARDAATVFTQEDLDAFEAEAAVFRILLLVIAYISGTILTGFLAAVTGQAVLGRPASFGDAWATVRPKFWRLIGTALLGGLIILGASLPLVLPGIYFYVAFSLSGPVLILENQSVTQALRRSWDLVKGSWWRIFGILLLARVLAGVIGLALQVPFGLGNGGLFLGQDDAAFLSTSDIALLSLAGAVAATVTGPFVAGVHSLLYVDRRMRREGLDVTLAATAASQPAGQPPRA